MSTVDIMLPYYGPVGMMQETVRSILAQDDPDWRLTIVDDGYPDDSIPEWFDSLNDSRIRYLRNERNLGANRNCQKCVNLIDHDLAVIMNADDQMLPNYVNTVRAAHEAHPDIAAVQPGVQVIDTNGKPTRGLVDEAKRLLYALTTKKRLVMRAEDAATNLLRGNWLQFSSLCWRSDALKTTDLGGDLDAVHDLSIVMDAIEEGGSILFEPELCFRYRRHNSSDSALRAGEGSRFTEEREFFLRKADRMTALGWQHAASAARWHVSSRLNALTRLPAAIQAKQRSSVRTLIRHVLGISDQRARNS